MSKATGAWPRIGRSTKRVLVVTAMLVGGLGAALALTGGQPLVRAGAPTPLLHVVASGGGDVPGCPASSPCTLKRALMQAHTTAAITISLGSGDYTGPLVINQSVTIIGAGENSTKFIETSAGSPVIAVDAGTVTLEKMTISGGDAHGEKYGAGGLDNAADLTLESVDVTGNTFKHGVDGAGGVVNVGTLDLVDSTVANNSATDSYSCAGGIANDGTMTLTNSTVDSNECTGKFIDGVGGISNGGYVLARDDDVSPGNVLSLTGSTISSNTTTVPSCPASVVCWAAGGILNDGTSSISGSTLSDNTAQVNGGGVLNEDALTVSDSTITGNSANVDGGAIDSGDKSGTGTGSITISGSTFSQNSANSDGGAIDSGDNDGNGTITDFDSTFSDNSAANGGAIDSGDNFGDGTLTESDATFSGNSANSDGGAIDSGDDYGDGTLTESDATFSGNSAALDGGAIDSGDDSGNATLTESDATFSENTADKDGGAIDSADEYGTATLTSTDSTFSSNSADWDGGAIDNGDEVGNGTLTVTDSTFSSNSADSDGGAIDNGDEYGNGSATLDASTFSGDTADSDGPEIDSGDTASNSASVTALADIFDGSCDQNGTEWDDEGYNVGVDSSCFVGPAVGDDESAGSGLTNELDPLAYNGGLTETMDPATGNPAIGIIPAGTSVGGPPICPWTDQRGAESAGGQACDAGAYQTSADPYTATVTLSPRGTVVKTVDASEKVTASIEIDGVAAPAGVPVTMTVTGVDSQTSTAVTGAGGKIAFTYINNGSTGSDTVTIASAITPGPTDPGSVSSSLTVNWFSVAYAYADGLVTSSPSACPKTTVPADQCSLAAALSLGAAASKIVLASPASTPYYGNFVLTASVPIAPAGSVSPVLDGDASGAVPCPTTSCDGPVLTVASGVETTLSSFTIQDGDNTTGNGGAIDDDASSLDLSDMTISGDETTNSGGGVYVENGSSLAATGSTFSDDTAGSGADGGGNGGAIDSGDNGGSGTVSVTDSTFTDDEALLTVGASCSCGGWGGAISSGNYDGEGSLTVTGSSFGGDLAPFGGGAIASGDDSGGGSFSISQSSFDEDGSVDGGGAICDACYLGEGSGTISESSFTGDLAIYGGGAIDNGDDAAGDGGVLSITGTATDPSTFSDDEADFGGAIGNGLEEDGLGALTVTNTVFSEDEADYNGGAIDNGDAEAEGANDFTTLTVKHSSFDSNGADNDGGAIDNADDGGVGQAAVSWSTFDGNSAGGNGGAFDNADYVSLGALSIIESTLTANSASGNGSVLDNGDDGGTGHSYVLSSTVDGNSGATTVVNSYGVVGIGASILADSGGQNCGGEMTDFGFNLEDDPGDSCGFNTTGHDLVGESPDLGSLAYNGGPTMTMVPTISSPVLDQVPFGTGVTRSLLAGNGAASLCQIDQRGVEPSESFGCAIGAVDVTNTSLPIVGGLSVTKGGYTGGTVVTLRGSNLGSVTAVTFGNNSADILFAGPGTLTVVAPPGTAKSTVEVVATNPAGTSPFRAVAEYKYLSTP